jgi:hypothetical protein
MLCSLKDILLEVPPNDIRALAWVRIGVRGEREICSVQVHREYC